MVAFEHCVQLDYAVSADAARMEHVKKRSALRASLRDVEELLGRDDPQAVDAGALMLDGLLSQLVSEWFAERGAEVPSREKVLAALERREGYDSQFVARLRLALRAPDPHARLAQYRELLPYIEHPSDIEFSNDVNNEE
ncbi:MAG TPA: hypothetical protein VF510_03485 [Ktedonobacterales bacterium]